MIEQPQNPTLPIPRVTSSVFCSDNLELMKTIESNTIDLIYCDILYGTGRKFKDYQDLKPIRSEIENHYIPRIKEMHRILKPTGSIYLQMDTRINHWMRILMDEVFGYDNFRNEIVWHYANTMTKGSVYFKKSHDIILLYSKSNIYTFNPQKELREFPINQSKRVWKDGKNMRKRDENGKMETSVSIDRLVTDVISIPFLASTAKERTGYSTQKPKELISRFILASTNEGYTVADYYLGSGTTAVVCKELNRNFIGCDINPNAIEITNARLDAVS